MSDKSGSLASSREVGLGAGFRVRFAAVLLFQSKALQRETLGSRGQKYDSFVSLAPGVGGMSLPAGHTGSI